MQGSLELKRLLKFLLYVLGERPDEFGLVPENQGWVDFRDLFAALSQEDGLKGVRERDLQAASAASEKREIEIDGTRVRASVRRFSPPSPESNPPKLLYLCVREKGYPVAADEGVRPGRGPYLLLSPEKEKALLWGKRRGAEVLLTINTKMAWEQGASFLRFGESLYLSAFLPKDSFTGPSLAKMMERREKKPETQKHAPSAPPMWGSFSLDLTGDRREKSGNRGRKKRTWKDGGR